MLLSDGTLHFILFSSSIQSVLLPLGDSDMSTNDIHEGLLHTCGLGQGLGTLRTVAWQARDH